MVLRSVLLFLIILIATSFSYSSPVNNTIKDIRFNSGETFTRVVIECDQKISYEQNQLKFPERLYFDLYNTNPASFHKKEIEINDKGIETIRIGKFSPTIARVVIKLDSYNDINVYTLESPHRLVIDVNHGSQLEKFIPRKRVVVIDAGHGGKDPGAIGRRGLREKDVVLDIAKRLKKVLESKYAVTVYLTRNNDRFIELRKRAAYANKKNADLFVSIHANATRKRNVKGIETWFLNYTDNEAYQKVAARENAISLEEQKKYESDEAQILASLDTSLKRDSSIIFANYVRESIIKQLRMKYKNRIKDLSTKWARFYVLYTDMPSTLIEVGYITNVEEEKLLRQKVYRKNMAYAIAKGINSYLSIMPDMPKLAMR
jgi:N-acetylmuramoyl-L-alanine amidase